LATNGAIAEKTGHLHTLKERTKGKVGETARPFPMNDTTSALGKEVAQIPRQNWKPRQRIQVVSTQ